MNRVAGLLLLCAAASLLMFAGHLDVMSLEDWRQIVTRWTPPAPDDLERTFAAIVGIVCMVFGWGLFLGSK